MQKRADWININVSQNNYNPITVNDVVSGKQAKIHKILYTYALEQAILNNANGVNPDFTVIREIPSNNKLNIIKCAEQKGKWIKVNSYDDYINFPKGYIDLSKWRIYEDTTGVENYYEPTKIVCISKQLVNDKGALNYKKIEIDLKHWWNADYSKEINKKIEATNSIEDTYPFNDIVEYDYINGKAKLENRIEDTERWIRFNEISEKDNLNLEDF